MKSINTIVLMFVIGATSLAGTEALAQNLTRQMVLEHLLAIDDPINTPAIKQGLPNASQVLCELATDSATHWYARSRAASALTEMGDEPAFSCLQALAATPSTENTLRALSVYLLGRRFGAERPAVVFPVLQKAAASKLVAEREYAIRALAYLPKTQAVPALRQILKQERTKTLQHLVRNRLRRLERAAPATGK